MRRRKNFFNHKPILAIAFFFAAISINASGLITKDKCNFPEMLALAMCSTCFQELIECNTGELQRMGYSGEAQRYNINSTALDLAYNFVPGHPCSLTTTVKFLHSL